MTNIGGIDLAFCAQIFFDHPPNISLLGGGRLLNMHIYVYSHYIQYNDKLSTMISCSYKRMSNLLSSAQIKHSSLAGTLYLQT